MKEFLTCLPKWLLTALTVALILWLTLAPDPLGEETPVLFPGADKIVHGLMFGFLTVMVLLDRTRQNGWRKIPGWLIFVVMLATSAFGIAIEFVQRAMEMGRGFETADMIADCTGAIAAAYLWKLLQSCWSVSDSIK